jgi:hypothetical protein
MSAEAEGSRGETDENDAGEKEEEWGAEGEEEEVHVTLV